MLTMHRVRQAGPQPLDIAAWSLDEDYPVFPVGSKPKRLVVCPQDATAPFLIPGHKYLFKAAKGWQSQQLWSEIVAYELARPLGLTVPPCFVALDSKTDEMGVLIEFFYGYPGDQTPPRFIAGSDLLQRVYTQPAEYDQKTGRPHWFRFNVALCRALQIDGSTMWWAKTFPFDTLIGNTDRHPENWGVLFTLIDPKRPSPEMAPIFDNGTSLAYEIRDETMTKGWTIQQIAQYLSRGTHHCALSNSDRKGGNHLDLCVHFRAAFPATSTAIESVIQLSDLHVEDAVNLCTTFDGPLAFSSSRAEFVYELVRTRRDQLARAMGG
jgi:HipA-like C-terminal domain